MFQQPSPTTSLFVCIYKVGTPTVAGEKVTATIVRQARSRKRVVLTRKPGKYVKKNGHRQNYTGLFITEVNNGAGESDTATHTKKAAPKKTEKTEKKAAPKKPAAKKPASKKKTTKKKATKK